MFPLTLRLFRGNCGWRLIVGRSSRRVCVGSRRCDLLCLAVASPASCLEVGKGVSCRAGAGSNRCMGQLLGDAACHVDLCVSSYGRWPSPSPGHRLPAHPPSPACSGMCALALALCWPAGRRWLILAAASSSLHTVTTVSPYLFRLHACMS